MRKTTLVIIMSVFLLSCWIATTSVTNAVETPSGIPFSELDRFIDDYVVQYIGKTSPGAAVVVVKDGEIIFSKGYGYANIEKGILVDSASTVFEYASISKLFVYTTIMQLKEAGRIDLRADIREYLPKGFLKNLEYNEPITMLNIMNHTTGFEDYLFDVILTTSKNRPSLEQTLLDCQPMQVYKPGTISAYSNYAVALAAYIAEQIIGQDFYEYLMESIFLSLNMNKTSAHPLLSDKFELLDTKAYGYYPQKKAGFTLGSWSYVPLYPAGSVNGTAEDLAYFAIALMPEAGQDSLLFNKRETLDEMLTQSHQMGPQLHGFAHGFMEWDGEYRGVGHGGNSAAFSTQLNIVPEERFGVIVLTNASNEMDISAGLTEALIGRRDKSVMIGVGDLPSAKEVEGTYISARRMHRGFLELYGYLSLLKVKALEPNKIQLSMAGQSSTLVQTSPYVFERVDADGAIFEYHFGTVYFEMSDAKVVRMSGDYLPLPSGRTEPWLVVSLLIVILSALYFLLTPIVLLVGKWRKRREGMNAVSCCSPLPKAVTLLALCGTAILANNALLLVRMIVNNFRSFSEVRIHILLNYPLTGLAVMLTILVALNLKSLKLSRQHKVFSLATVFTIVAFISTLINWQFFKVIA